MHLPRLRLSIRTLMGSVLIFAVGLAVLKNAGELALGMILVVALGALGTRWPYQASSQDAES
jgi:hypothetical protein